MRVQTLITVDMQLTLLFMFMAITAFSVDKKANEINQQATGKLMKIFLIKEGHLHC